MSHKWRARLAILLVLIGFLLYILAVVFVYLGRSASLPADWEPRYSLLISSLPLLPGLFLGGLLIIKLPGNSYGWVWLALSLAACLQTACQNYAIYALMVYPGALPFGWAAASISGMCWFVMISMVPLALLLFPTGRPPTRRWRLLLWVILAAIVVVLAMAWWTYGAEGVVPIPNPNKISGAWVEWLEAVGNVVIGIVFLALPISAVSLLHRYRLADVNERKQLKWFAYGAILFVLTLGGDFLYTAPGAWEPLKEALFFAILPATIGIAILRYRLWDIDIIIRRTLVYSILSATLALVFFGGVALMQRVFGALSGTENSPISIVLSTLAIAGLFSPLRSRVQDFIDRRFYRRKYNAEQALARFSAKARDETDIEQLSAELVAVVQEAMQPESVSLWLKKAK
jgi:hypothetical protein